MIQDPRVRCTQIPLHLPGRRMRIEDRWGAASSDLPRKHAFCLVVVWGQHPGYGAEGLIHTPLAHGDITACSRHCLLNMVEVRGVLPAVPGLVLVGTVAVSGAVWNFLPLALMSSAMVLPPEDTPEAAHSSVRPSAKMPLSDFLYLFWWIENVFSFFQFWIIQVYDSKTTKMITFWIFYINVIIFYFSEPF